MAYTDKVTANITVDIAERLDAESRRTGKTRSGLVREALVIYLDRQTSMRAQQSISPEQATKLLFGEHR